MIPVVGHICGHAVEPMSSTGLPDHGLAWLHIAALRLAVSPPTACESGGVWTLSLFPRKLWKYQIIYSSSERRRAAYLFLLLCCLLAASAVGRERREDPSGNESEGSLGLLWSFIFSICSAFLANMSDPFLWGNILCCLAPTGCW